MSKLTAIRLAYSSFIISVCLLSFFIFFNCFKTLKSGCFGCFSVIAVYSRIVYFWPVGSKFSLLLLDKWMTGLSETLRVLHAALVIYPTFPSRNITARWHGTRFLFLKYIISGVSLVKNVDTKDG